MRAGKRGNRGAAATLAARGQYASAALLWQRKGRFIRLCAGGKVYASMMADLYDMNREFAEQWMQKIRAQVIRQLILRGAWSQEQLEVLQNGFSHDTSQSMDGTNQ